MILLPVFVQVALRDIALGQQAWPERPTKIANCFGNQFQVPMLFYVLVALALFTRQADLLFVVMSWIFVATRLLHAFIHVGSNYVRHRFYAYAVGVIVLLLMWIIFMLRILLAIS